MIDDKRRDMNVLTGLTKNAGWEHLVKAKYKRLKELHQAITTADTSKLLSDITELSRHCEMIQEAKTICSFIEYPAQQIRQLNKELGNIIKGDDDD